MRKYFCPPWACTTSRPLVSPVETTNASVPASMGYLSGLHELTLKYIRLTELPTMGGGSSLKTLTVDETALAGLQSDFGSLRKLSHLSL